MESASSGAPGPPADHEVIVISDDESDNSSEEAPWIPLLPWPDVAEKLLLLAKHRVLRVDQQAVAALLQEAGLPAVADVNRSLRLACEKLGDLLAFCRGHDRRYRASEDLVVVLCEVLSLAQRQSSREHPRQQVKMEPDMRGQRAVLRELLQMMEKWRLMVEECSRTSIGRERALNGTIAHLEAMIETCSNEIVQLQEDKEEYEVEMDTAAEEWAKTMECCRSRLEHESIDETEQTWRIFDETFRLTGDIQTHYAGSKCARNALVRQAQEADLRRGFYQAAQTLTYTVAQVMDCREHKEQQQTRTPEELFNCLGNEMLIYLETFGEGLRTVCGNGIESTRGVAAAAPEEGHQLELLSFSKHFEAFWLVQRNWLPPAVLIRL